jgi:putative endonuclease
VNSGDPSKQLAWFALLHDHDANFSQPYSRPQFLSIEKDPTVYILSSCRHGTLYIGVTSDLYGRMQQHKQGLFEGFTKKYSVTILVYYEMHPDMSTAIKREKQLKKWNRAWKLRLIELMNPEWTDLYDEEDNAILPGPSDQARGFET